MVLLLMMYGSAVRAGDDQQAFVELVVNDVDRGVALVILREREVWLPVSGLETAGLRAFGGRRAVIDQVERVEMSSLHPLVTSVFNERDLTLTIVAPPEMFAVTQLTLEQGRPSDLAYLRTPSAFMNYAATWRPDGGTDAFIEAAVSVGAASIDSGFSRLAADNRVVRGLTTMTIDSRSRLQRWTAGDVTALAGPLDAGLIVGGISFARDYSLDPYYQRYPSPALAGSTTTPSTIDVYVNNQLVRQETLPPGPFQLTRVPLTTGLGTTRVVVRDAFGREQQFGEPFYLTTSVLRRGTRDFQYALGFSRSLDLTQPAVYGPLTGLAAERFGVSDSVTAGFRFEGDRRTWNGGSTLNARLWRLGELEWAAEGSRQAGRSGAAAHLAYAFTTRVVSVSAIARAFSPNFATLTTPAMGRTATQFGGTVSAPLGRRLSVSLQHAADTLSDIEPGRASKNQRTALSTTWRVAGALDIYSTVATGRQGDQSRQLDAFVGATVLLGSRAVAGVTFERAGSQPGTTTVDVQQSLPVGTGFGYRFRGESAGDQSAHGEIDYQGSFGRYAATKDVGAGAAGSSVSASGGVVAIGGGVHLTRAVSNSFALVRVADAPGVRVYNNNQEVGRTDGGGELLVPNLLPNYGNLLSIADADLPFAFEIEQTAQNVAPPFRGGALAPFRAKRIQAVFGKIVVLRGGTTAVPVYGEVAVTVGGLRRVSPIGADGEFYFESLPPGLSPATVTFGGATCVFTLEIKTSTAALLDLGTQRCNADISTGVQQ